MSKSWMTIENDFPSFTGRESPQEMISKLTDYLFKLTNQLKYTLQNLDTNNWNKKALEGFSASTTEGVEESVRLLTSQMGQLSAALNSLSGRVSDTSVDLRHTQDTVTRLEADNENAKVERLEIQTDISQNQEAITALQQESIQAQQERGEMQADIDEIQAKDQERDGQITSLNESLGQLQVIVTQLQETVNSLTALIQAVDGVLTLGAEGARIDLIGDLYINGVAYA